MTRYGRDSDGRRDAEEDEQRRHKEAAANAEQARDVADCNTHTQYKEDVYGQVGNGKIYLQALSSGA